MMTAPGHIPVLLNEVLAVLSPQAGQIYLDCTAGLGGHAASVAERLGPAGTVILMDLDAANLTAAAARVRSFPGSPTVHALHASFAAAPRELARLNLRADLVLADLGFASPQVEDPARGFSFSRDGPLDMRLNPAAGPTAADLVHSLSQGDLTQLIRDYGEERHASAVATRIVQARQEAPILRTSQLADLIRSVVRRSPGGIDPATRTFQALRIAVNDELGNLGALLAAIGSPVTPWLAPMARVGAITFHSLEDRPVKQAFTRLVGSGRARDLTDGLITPTPAETAENPRSASAKLRAIELVPPATTG